MKEIWINLELYIKSYEFSILGIFFWIFLDLFQLLNNKNELKKGKKRVNPTRDPRECDVAAPRGPTRRNIYLYLYSLQYI